MESTQFNKSQPFIPNKEQARSAAIITEEQQMSPELKDKAQKLREIIDQALKIVKIIKSDQPCNNLLSYIVESLEVFQARLQSTALTQRTIDLFVNRVFDYINQITNIDDKRRYLGLKLNLCKQVLDTNLVPQQEQLLQHIHQYVLNHQEQLDDQQEDALSAYLGRLCQDIQPKPEELKVKQDVTNFLKKNIKGYLKRKKGDKVYVKEFGSTIQGLVLTKESDIDFTIFFGDKDEDLDSESDSEAEEEKKTEDENPDSSASSSSSSSEDEEERGFRPRGPGYMRLRRRRNSINRNNEHYQHMLLNYVQGRLQSIPDKFKENMEYSNKITKCEIKRNSYYSPSHERRQIMLEVKVQDQLSGFNQSFEILHNKQLEIELSKLIAKYVEISPKFKQAAMLLKHWNNLNFCDRKSRINNYQLIVMLIAFMQHKSYLPYLQEQAANKAPLSKKEQKRKAEKTKRRQNQSKQEEASEEQPTLIQTEEANPNYTKLKLNLKLISPGFSQQFAIRCNIWYENDLEKIKNSYDHTMVDLIPVSSILKEFFEFYKDPQPPKEGEIDTETRVFDRTKHVICISRGKGENFIEKEQYIRKYRKLIKRHAKGIVDDERDLTHQLRESFKKNLFTILCPFDPTNINTNNQCLLGEDGKQTPITAKFLKALRLTSNQLERFGKTSKNMENPLLLKKKTPLLEVKPVGYTSIFDEVIEAPSLEELQKFLNLPHGNSSQSVQEAEHVSVYIPEKIVQPVQNYIQMGRTQLQEGIYNKERFEEEKQEVVDQFTRLLFQDRPTEAKQAIGEFIYCYVEQLKQSRAPKLTGILLDVEESRILDYMQSYEKFLETLNEAYNALIEHERSSQ